MKSSKQIKEENELIQKQYESVLKEDVDFLAALEPELDAEDTSEAKADARDDNRHAYYELIGALHNKHLIRTDKHDPSLEEDELTIATGGRHSVRVRVLGYHKPHKQDLE